MLLEECRVAQRRIEACVELRAASELAEGYATRHKMLKTSGDGLRPLVSTRNAFRTRAIAHEVPAAALAAISPRLDQVRAEYRTKPDSILGQRALGSILRDLQSLAPRLTAMLAAAWASYVDDQHVEISDQLLAVLDQVPALREATKQVRTSQANIARRRATLPKANSDIADLDSAVAELRSQWHLLTGDGLPREVMEFIRAAAGGGAQLELLTDEVRQWLISRAVKDAFHVVVRRSS